MRFCLLSLLLVGLACTTTALVRVEVELFSYDNPSSAECDGDHCEGLLGGTCDNQFDFCVRTVGSSQCLVTLSSDEIEDDSLTFTIDELDDLSISNPLRFTSIATTVPLEVYVVVTDIDFGGNDDVDEITIPIPRNLQADGQQTPLRTYTGRCGRANLEARISIISECPANMYGPQCTVECVEAGGQRICNYLGEATCLGNFVGPTCTECKTGFQEPGSGCTSCAPNYYPAGICTTFCIPMDNSLAHYTCDPVTGMIICLPGYTDTSNDCRFCEGNFREPDCVGCDTNFAGPSCDVCIPDHYPQGICNRRCVPRNDALGHYTCNELGNRVCLSGYTDPSTNCVTCEGNRREPDCILCDDNYLAPACTTCIPRRTGPRCSECEGNFQGTNCTDCKINFIGANCDTCAPNYYPPGECFCTPRDDSGGHFTCDTVTGERICLEGFFNPERNCVDSVPIATTAKTTNEGFVGSPAFTAIIAVVVAVPLGAFFIILLVLCCLCLLSSDVDCSCPKIDCDDCCSSFFKSLSCGLKCNDLNPIVICTIVVLGLLAAPIVIIVMLPVLICVALLYGLANCSD